jgi:tetratricopeptide (TPR) repeat protein
MAKGIDTQRSAEQLKEVAIFLKQADKLVRDGNYASALDEIAKARGRDPRNLYALAYEERVRSLLTAQKEKKIEAENNSQPVPPEQPLPTALEHISNLAIVEAQRSAAVAAKQEQEAELRKREEDERKKNDELRRQAIESKIATFLTRAHDYIAKEDFNRALDEVARAYLLDPANEHIHELEDHIRKAQEEARLRDEQERLRKQQEEEQKRQDMLKAQIVRFQQEKEEKRRKEEEARKHAQHQKITQYLDRAKEFFNNGRLDEALSELAFVVVVDPLNEDVLNLEHQIREAQDNEQQAQLEILRRREEEQRKKREAIVTAIQKHIENAEKLAEQQRFSEALRVITRAYVLDPVNDALQACEKRIAAAQEEALDRAQAKRQVEEETVRRRQEEELRLLEQTERDRATLGENVETEAKRRTDKEKIFAYITKARTYLSEERFEDALGEVALAFIVDPFDEDIKHTEQEILSAQDKKKTEEAIARTIPEVQEIIHDDTAERIAACLTNAEKFAEEHQYSQALDELAKAFILDPLNTSIQGYENQLQREWHAHQEEERKKTEDEARLKALATHLQRAHDYLEHGAFDEALAEVAGGYAYEPENVELKNLEETIQAAYQQWQEQQGEKEKDIQVQDLLLKAKQLLVKDRFEDALTVVTQAMVLDPERQDIKDLELEIETAQTVFDTKKHAGENNKVIQKHLFATKELRALRKYDDAVTEIEKALLLDPTREDCLKLKDQIIRDIEEYNQQKKDQSRHETLKQHVRQAREYVANKIYDEAMVEIAMGLTIDPENETLKELEEQIVLSQTEADEVAPAELKGTKELTASPEERDQLVHIHLRTAEEYQKQEEFAKALDEVAKAFVLDPLNKEIKKTEVRIRQNEIRHAQQTGQTLKLVYPHDKAVGENS